MSTSHEIWNIFPVRSHLGTDHCVQRPVKPILSSSVSAGRSKGWAESSEWLQFSLLTHTEMKPDKGFSICLVQLLHATHGRPAVFSTLFFSLCRGYFCIVEVKRTWCQSILSAVQQVASVAWIWSCWQPFSRLKLNSYIAWKTVNMSF